MQGGSRPYQWEHPLSHLDDLGFALPQEQRDLAQQGEGLALTLLRVLDPAEEGGSWVIPYDGDPLLGTRHTVLPAVITFGPDVLLESCGQELWQSDLLCSNYDENWDEYESKVGMVDDSEAFWLSPEEPIIVRIWDCWPITEDQAKVFESHLEAAWNSTEYSLWHVFIDMYDQFRHTSINPKDAWANPEAWVEIYSEGRAKEAKLLQTYWEVYRLLFDEDDMARPYRNPEEAFRSRLPPDCLDLFDTLVHFSLRGWRAAEIVSASSTPYLWRHQQERLSPWF